MDLALQKIAKKTFVDHYPPKSQLLKWIGNKQRFAVEITSYFPKTFNRYFEPFLGSGAILATVNPKIGFGSDTFSPLMEIWDKLSCDPGGLVSWYAERRSLIGPQSKENVYKQVLKSYNSAPNGADFLFLTRACYGGIVRFRKTDGYMSTPCGVHTPISIDSFEKRVIEWRERIKNVSFQTCDYKTAFSKAKSGDLIYCDPPYSHSQSILYGAQDFKLEDLFSEIRKAKSKNIYVAMSIDGHKKSGNLLRDLDIPATLFENEIYIKCGRSMLRRFQLEGKTRETELVSDRLLLTY